MVAKTNHTAEQRLAIIREVYNLCLVFDTFGPETRVGEHLAYLAGALANADDPRKNAVDWSDWSTFGFLQRYLDQHLGRDHPVWQYIVRADPPWPVYGNQDALPVMGVYLAFFHGFRSEEERSAAGDWGVNGPVIGPLSFVQTTYGSHIKFDFAIGADLTPYSDLLDISGGSSDLTVANGTVKLADVYYGDWTVFYYEKTK